MSEGLELTWMLILHLALTAVPAAAAVLVAVRGGLRSVPLLLGIALVASGAGAMLAFWAYYTDPMVGQAVSFLLVLGSVQAIAWASWSGLDREILRRLATPAALWVLSSAFVLFLGFLHGGQDEPVAMAATRFSHSLPVDNDIPRYFSEWFYEHGRDGSPLPLFSWLSSDRPPLQVGYVLSQRPFGWDEVGLHYQVTGVVVQQLWILGMWAVLCAARIRPAARGLAMFAVIVSDFAILHGFFVWPKLLAAAFLLGALAIVVSPSWAELRRSNAVAALFAALCALAMLAHGASAFVLLPLLGFAAWRGMPSWRWLAVAALVGFVALAPWSAYQRFADPPGDRLLKWQLGGMLEVTDEGALETIADGYAEAGAGGTLENKWRNLTSVAGVSETREGVRLALDYAGEGSFGNTLAALRFPRFISLLPLLGVFLLAPLAMAVARIRGSPGGAEWRFALQMLGFCVLATLVWVLLMFGGQESNATVHVGSLALPLLAICACTIGLYAVSRLLALAVVAIGATTSLALCVPSLMPIEGTSYSPFSAALATTAFAALAFLCLRGDPGDDGSRPYTAR
ncbi:MAG TPA: hypothetical protein VNO20_03705 [Solirubrobacterales bacterium]|nr:hypothetical protein [Solirubrobacterales bacterium]